MDPMRIMVTATRFVTMVGTLSIEQDTLKSDSKLLVRIMKSPDNPLNGESLMDVSKRIGEVAEQLQELAEQLKEESEVLEEMSKSNERFIEV